VLIRILGFGSIGRGLVPLLIRNGVSPLSIHVFDKSDEHADLAHQMNVAFTQIQVTKENYQEFVRKYCTAGDVLLNLAVMYPPSTCSKKR
jgi:homospermidine synthase